MIETNKSRTLPSWAVTITLAVMGWLGLIAVQVLVSYYILETHVNDMEQYFTERLVRYEQDFDDYREKTNRKLEFHDQRTDGLTGRVIKLEAIMPQIRDDIEDIKRMLDRNYPARTAKKSE